ncbi:hypothetical protein [Desulfosarcina ovata]|uniref:Uncharacterized protein n=2 Tax=Desulfosarcina ovata TaxID=83564 RepID=A0A5K8ANI5_9BACT|nr:hypothetical protein [Desulfosarcina ovata]BBO86574.1 hypothetical protein DSCO28_71400 [Desulfosarcina ovata subsp. sediminis]BBO93430.1 hypothetical protein DSCOOX_66100 [Desulfosarcina ovata subsp. ovata]
MIVDRPGSHFIFVVSSEHVHRGYNYVRYAGKPLTNGEYLQYWGKWVFFGNTETLADFARQMDPFVEKKVIPAAKYDREIIEAFELGECVMCVYCDFRQRDDVWGVLESIGVADKMWVFEKETMERWMPGGHLLEKWIEGKSLSGEAADKVRADARQTFETMFADEDAEFKGVMQ